MMLLKVDQRYLVKAVYKHLLPHQMWNYRQSMRFERVPKPRSYGRELVVSSAGGKRKKKFKADSFYEKVKK